MKFYFSITYLCVNFLNEWLWMIFSWCLWECDPLCDLWWSQWMFDLRWIPGAAICRGNHDPHLLSWLSWLLTADSWRLSRSVPRPHPLVTPGLFSSPGLSGPVIMTAGERREGGDEQPPPGTAAEEALRRTRTPTECWELTTIIQSRAEWALGFCSEVQCSIVLCRACRIGHVYFRVG